MEPLLELRDINYAYHSVSGETYALSNISFSVRDGEFIAVVGPSGCGNAMGEQRQQMLWQPPIFLCFLPVNGCHR